MQPQGAHGGNSGDNNGDNHGNNDGNNHDHDGVDYLPQIYPTGKGVTQDGNHANDAQDGDHRDHANDSALVEILREELAEKNRQISELHRLLAQTALNAAPPRPWWRFWR